MKTQTNPVEKLKNSNLVKEGDINYWCGYENGKREMVEAVEKMIGDDDEHLGFGNKTTEANYTREIEAKNELREELRTKLQMLKEK